MTRRRRICATHDIAPALSPVAIPNADRGPAGDCALDGLAAYEAAFEELIGCARQTLRVFDRSLGRRFDTPRRHDLLRRFLLAGRSNRVYIVLHDPTHIARDCPRLMALLRQFSHGMHVHRTLAEARCVYDPFAVADETMFVRRFHFDTRRGVASRGDWSATQLLLKRFDEIWQASRPAVTATTLGL